MTINVLVIDDDEISSTMTAAWLERQGMQVVTMVSPIGATRAVLDNDIDIVVCDLNMPAMRGDAFARLFRRSRMLRHLPLIVISGAPKLELTALMSEGTVDAVIHKSDAERHLGTLLLSLVEKLRAG